MKRIFVTAAFAALAFASTAAAAETTNGWYGSAGAGIATMNDPEFTVTDGGDTLVTDLKTDNGFAANAQLGYRFGAISVGGELSYQQHNISGIDFRSVNGVTVTAGDIDDIIDALEADGLIDSTGLTHTGTVVTANGGDLGKLRQVGAMANVRYDIATGSPVEPYVLGGLGFAATHVEGFDDEGSTHTSFAWQVGAGVGVAVSENVKLSADWRYREAAAGDLDDGLHLGKTGSHFFGASLRVGF